MAVVLVVGALVLSLSTVAKLIRSTPSLRTGWIATGLALLLLSASALTYNHHQNASNWLLITAAAAFVTGAAWAWWMDRRSRWTWDEACDGLTALVVTVGCGWQLLLGPLHHNHTTGGDLLAAIVLVTALALVSLMFVTVGSSRCLEALVTPIFALGVTAFAVSQAEVLIRWRSQIGPSASDWLMIAFLGAAMFVVAQGRLRPSRVAAGASTQSFRTTMIFCVATLIPITASVAQAIESERGYGLCAMMLVLTLTVLTLRFVRFIRQISRLEANRMTRDSLITIPVGALSVDSDRDFETLLGKVLELGANIFDAERAQLSLTFGAADGAERFHIDRGLTDTEQTILHTHPRLDPSICLAQDGTWRPLRIRRDDIVLPVATQGAWAVAGKMESLLIPIHSAENAIGLLELWSPNNDLAIRDGDLDTAATFGADAGQAIEHAYLVVRTRSQVEQAEMLLTVSEVFSRGHRLDLCLSQVAERLLGRGGSDRITIGVIERQRSEIQIAAEFDRDPASHQTRAGFRFPLDQWLTYSELRRSGNVEIWSRAESVGSEDPRLTILDQHDAESLLAIPAYIDGQLRVIIQIVSRTNVLSDSAELRAIWRVVAQQIQFGIESISALQESRRSERLEALRRRINEALQSVDDLTQNYESIARAFHRVPDVHGATILSWDDDRRGFVVEADWAEPPIASWDIGTLVSTDSNDLLAEISDSSGPRMMWQDSQTLSDEQRERMVRHHIGTALSVPLRNEDRFVGGLLLVSHNRNGFSEETVSLAGQLAATLSLVMKAIELRRQQASQADEQAFKLQLMEAATSRDDPQQALEAIARIGLGRHGAESINIAFFDHPNNRIIIAADTTLPDWPGVDAPGTVLPILRGSVQEEALISGRLAEYSSLDADLNEHSRSDIDLYGAEAWLALPLTVQDRPIGLLQVLSRDPHAFPLQRKRLWGEISHQIAPVVRSLQLSMDNDRLSLQRQLGARINEVAAVSTRIQETWDQLAAICLIDDVQCATIFVWHAEDRILEVESESARPTWLARSTTGERIDAQTWHQAGWTARANEISHFWMGDSRLTEEAEVLLDHSDAGSMLVFPLINKAQIDGVLALRRNATGPFAQDTIELGGLLAAHLAPVVHNLRGREDQARIEAENAILLEISNVAARSNNAGAIHEAILSGLCDLSNGTAGWLFAATPDNLAHECITETRRDHLGLHDTRWLNTQPPLPLEMLRNDRPVTIPSLADIELAPNLRAELERAAADSCVVVPILLGKSTSGVLVIAYPESKRITRVELGSLWSVAERASLIVEKARASHEERQVAEQRSILLQVSQASSNAFDLDRALAEITQASLRIANSESCAIELYEPDLNQLVLRSTARVTDWVITDNLDGKIRPFGSWSIDEEIRTNLQVNLSSSDDPRVSGQMRADMDHFHTESIVGRALISNGQYIGAFYIFSRSRHAYDGNDLWTINEISERIVATVQNARSLEAERRLALERERLLQISEAATSSLETGSVLQQIANSTIGLAGAECCHIETIDWDRCEFVTEAFACVGDWAQADTPMVGLRSPIGQWVIDEESISSTGVIVIESQQDKRVTGQLRTDMVDFGTQSIILIPIWLREECIGILNLYSRRAQAFSLDQQLLASTLAKQAANAIQNARTHTLERARRYQQEALVRLSNAATSSLDLLQAMKALCQEIHAQTGLDSATVGIFRTDLNSFEIAADFTIEEWDYRAAIGEIIAVSDYPVLEQVLSSTDTVRVRLGVSDELPAVPTPYHQHLQDMALIPLWFNDACVGYVGLFDRRPNGISDEHISLIESAGQTIVLAVSNALQWRDERRRSGNRSAIVEVGRIAVSDAPLSTKLDRVTSACLQIHEVDASFIVSLDEGANLGYLAWSDPSYTDDTQPPDLSGLHLSGILDRITDEGGIISFSNADPDLPSSLQAICLVDRPRQIVGFPLRTDERPLGYLVFASNRSVPIDEELRNVGRELATQVSLTISSSRLLETTRRYASEQSALLAVNRSVMSATQRSLQEALEHISLETMALIAADCCEIEGLLEGQHATELLAQVKTNDWDFDISGYGRILPLAEWPVTTRVLESRLPVTMNTDSTELSPYERQVLSQFGASSVLIAPMTLGERTSGIIAFYSRQRDFFSGEQVRLAMEFGSLAALAIDRARTHQALSEQASRDGLTGLLNRRALIHHLDHQIAVAERADDLVSVLMIDLNEFKAVNDRHGHLIGDTVLREFASQLEALLRSSDLVGRYGGDEFMAILPGTDMVAAISLARRIYDAIVSSAITLPDGSSITLSCSIGAATYPLDATDREGLIEIADRAMYLTKNANSAPKQVQKTQTGTLFLRSSAD